MTTLRCDNSRVSQMSMGLGRTIRENLSRMFATDDRGGSQGWNPAGEVTVLRSPHQPWLEIKPHVGVPGQAGPTLKIHSVPGQRVQLEQSTNLVTWTTVREIENSTGEVSVDLSTTDLPRSFYRVRSQ